MTLERSIKNTLAWFDIFDHPLTKEELYRFLWEPEVPLSYTRFLPHLEDLTDNGHIFSQDGFYFLPGKNGVVDSRQRKIPLIDRKLRVARRAARKLRWLPFVRAIFVTNTVAAGTATPQSDIDVLVVVRHGRLYLTRLLVTLILSVYRLRRTRTRIANRICLCFYLTDQSLNLAPIRLGEPDIYLAYWILELIPLYDPDHLRAEILRANTWVRRHLPHALLPQTLLYRHSVRDSRLSRGVKKFFEISWRGGYGQFLEREAKNIQWTKMKLNKNSRQSANDPHVVTSDSMLKFHENDRRSEYKNRWQERCATFAHSTTPSP